MKKSVLFLALTCAGLAAGQVTIGSGTAVDTNAGLSTPISIWYASSLSQTIYLSSEIGVAGELTSIEFKLNNSTSLTNSNDQIDVWVGHTDKSNYAPVVGTSGADWVPVSGHLQVLTNGSLSQSGTMVTFTFLEPFAYNGTDNLVITVDANEPNDDGSGVLFLQTAASANPMSLMIRTDNASDNADPLNPPLNFTGTTSAQSVQAKTTRPIITLHFEDLSTSLPQATRSVTVYPNPAVHEVFLLRLLKM